VKSDRAFDQRVGRDVFRARMLMPCVCALLTLVLAACSHKQVRAHIPVASPVDLETVMTLEDDIEPVPEPEVAPLQWPEPPRPPVRRRAPPHEDAGAAQPNEPTAPELTIGMLSPGGEASAQSQQQARDLIGSVDRRVASLPARIANAQKPQVRKVRYYLDQAKQALNTGDADGAANLATKARVMVDELERQ